MSSEVEANSAAVVIQVGDSEPEVHDGVSTEEVVDIVARADEGIAQRLKAAEDRVNAIRAEVVGDPDMTVEYFLMQRAQSRVGELLSHDLEHLDPEEHRARVDQYHRYAEVGSALLYRDRDFHGGSKFFTVTWPNFKWWPYKFNDAASSAKAWGGNILFQHTWYGGRRLYLIGLPYVEFPDLGRFEFNDMASSFVSLP
ncbi:hypothetical protein J2X01_003587 [Arthrobacter ginsengisoli]|uniref:Uncharacterized protein n=1 Tax=Arthrobacter ginsengisoli TaxID=1356565 RepID=A0ABU1UGH6_9MICC|nr:hypothetical protein [Arthrobacter ginsengisoli]MDR7084279.1 hypothetical protein [Arthrobacter ginsengisoli]